MNAIVAVVAIIAIAIVGYFAVLMLRGEQTNDGGSIDVDLGDNLDGDLMDGGGGR